MKYLVSIPLLTLTLIAAPMRLAAQTPTASEKPELTQSATGDRWYGHVGLVTTLVGDALMAAGLVVAVAGDPGYNGELGAALFLAGFSTYALGGPIHQFVKGEYGSGLGGLALRLGLPSLGFLGGGAVGAAAGAGVGGDAGIFRAALLMGGAAIGLLAGIIGGQVIDLYALYWEPAESSEIAVTPYVSLGKDRNLAGLTVAF